MELTGVTVYFTLPHPVAGVDAAADVHVPANTSMLTLGADGDVGVEPEDESLFPESRLQPADSVNASAIAARKRIDELPWCLQRRVPASAAFVAETGLRPLYRPWVRGTADAFALKSLVHRPQAATTRALDRGAWLPSQKGLEWISV